MPYDISTLDFEGLIAREWLATNGIGGYSCSTLCGMNTRKYHGILVAAMSPPIRRMVLLSQVDETISTPRGSGSLTTSEYPDTISPQGFKLLRAFDHEPFARWAFQGNGFTIEKSIRLMQRENTVCISYTLLTGTEPVRLSVRPLLSMRPIHDLMYQWNGRLLADVPENGQIHIPASAKTPEIFFAHDGEFQGESYWYLNTIYRREQERGYGGLEDLWSPGALRWSLSPGRAVHLVCSSEPVELPRVLGELDQINVDLDKRFAALAPDRADAQLSSLIKASHDYLVRSGRDDNAAIGVIGQYPWSSPNVRSALIGFTGLFLITGRFEEARQLLLGLASQLRDGLIPTEYPEDGQPASYNGADTSLWFINAVGSLAKYSSDENAPRALSPAVQSIVDAYRKGTKLGISCDAGGLLASHEPGIPTSWMDAKAGDWVVTPRSGKPVDLNALWYNALRISADLSERFGQAAAMREMTALADRVALSFTQKFWNPQAQCCFDVVDDKFTDASIRPNQLLAVSLPFPVLADPYRAKILEIVIHELLTPKGIRSLSPRDSNYHGHYGGNIYSRDRAQHQGSAYPWFLAHLAAAHQRVHGRNPQTILRIRQWLDGCLNYFNTDGAGQICELFDGDAPHRPGGAIASALSVAEILRSYATDVLGIRPRETIAHPGLAGGTEIPLPITAPRG